MSIQWQIHLWVEVMTYAVLVAVITGLSFGWGYGMLFFSGAFTLFAFVLRPWTRNQEVTARLINRQIETLQYSAGLLLYETTQLTSLGRLQQQRVSELLAQKTSRISPPFHFLRILTVLLIALPLTWGASWLFDIEHQDGNTSSVAEMPLVSMDSLSSSLEIPEVRSLEVAIDPPRYTALKASVQSGPHLEVAEGSWVTWQLKLSGPVDHVFMVSSGTKEYVMKHSAEHVYEGSARLTKKGFYNFRLVRDSMEWSTDLYTINIIPDHPPELKIKDLTRHLEYSYDESKKVQVRCEIADDYGIQDAYLIATVTKGSGESVKFREEKLLFDTPVGKNRSLILSKILDLDQMNMTPGDELYFYAEAVDNRYPEPQKNRTETFFLNIRDTVEVEFSLVGSLGVDIMPEYFRSQRQLIIDTEKLIRERSVLSSHDFNAESNALGFDQKALRIRYGQFMGEEFDTDVSGSVEEGDETSIDDPANVSEDDSEADPLAEFTHDHDGDNEHNLVEPHDHDHHHDHDHEHEHEHEHEHSSNDPEEEEDPLHAYQHIHDDPEEATFFTVSIREKLRSALNEMWDAELYLRLYEPEKSLSYQYRALELLKEIKNHARIYVHRIGFDPPPIKEDSRLKGDLDDVDSKIRQEEHTRQDHYVYMKRSTAMLEQLIRDSRRLNPDELDLLDKAGNELARLAVQQPGLHLQTLQDIRKLTLPSVSPGELDQLARAVMTGIARAIPVAVKEPVADSYDEHPVTGLFREQLDVLRRRQ